MVNGVTSNGNEITINSAGSYYITGEVSDANIVINAGKDDDVQLILDNCSITSTTTAPINGIQCDKLTITLEDNSENTITDSSTYTKFTDTQSSEPDGTIFTKTDLIINGSGKLIVNANYLDGIVSKDGLKIINANIEINSQDDGIRGKDYITINNAKIDINSKGDGIKSTNNEDTSLGYIAIEGGNINVNAEADGIQAETILNISKDAEINITTKGEVTSSANDSFEFNKRPGYTSSANDAEESSTSSKALKAGTEITIESGNIQISSTDDSIHSNGIIIINGGTISVVASDDGINISGGNDSSAMGGRPGENNFSNLEESNRNLVINNGKITVNADGDGLDSNGSIYINDGEVLVQGSINGGNGALDYSFECVVKGGDIIIYGATGMWQNPSNTSTQYCLTYGTSGNSGDKIVLKDSSGTQIASFTTTKSYGAITISNGSIKKGETYTLYVNDSSVGSLTANNIITSNSSSNMNGMQPNGGGMQQPGGRKRSKRFLT